jgi:hypothetical protein
MFLPAQLICRTKLGLKLKLSSSYMCREGGPHLLNAQTGQWPQLYKKWRWEFCINSARWNMRKPCLRYLCTEHFWITNTNLRACSVNQSNLFCIKIFHSKNRINKSLFLKFVALNISWKYRKCSPLWRERLYILSLYNGERLYILSL